MAGEAYWNIWSSKGWSMNIQKIFMQFKSVFSSTSCASRTWICPKVTSLLLCYLSCICHQLLWRISSLRKSYSCSIRYFWMIIYAEIRTFGKIWPVQRCITIIVPVGCFLFRTKNHLRIFGRLDIATIYLVGWHQRDLISSKRNTKQESTQTVTMTYELCFGSFRSVV